MQLILGTTRRSLCYQTSLLICSDSDQEIGSPSPPTYSPISEKESAESSKAGTSPDLGDSTDGTGDETDVDSEITTESSELQCTPLAAPDPDIPCKPEWNGFKIVGDNIDKNIRPSFHIKQNRYTIFTLTQ